MVSESIIIPCRFNGPDNSGNGGYVSGRLATYLQGPAAVRLRLPPPLETELRVEASDTNARLLHGSNLIAEGVRRELQIDPPSPPSYAEAVEASKGYVGFIDHPVPHCFVCGPRRPAQDGMNIFPGALAGKAMLAAPWMPDASLAGESGHVRPEFLWAALDCAGAFAVLSPKGRLVLLGEICARIERTVEPGGKCIVTGWAIAVEGRKRFAGTAVFSEAGELVAIAKATWVEIIPDAL